MLDNKDLLMEMQRRMLRIRRFEERVIQLVERGEIVGGSPFLHWGRSGGRRGMLGP